MRLLRYNLAPSLNGLIASLPSHTTPWIVDDPTVDFGALYGEFDTFVMGRRTYEAVLASMPSGGASLLAGRVVVFSSCLEGSDGGDGSDCGAGGAASALGGGAGSTGDAGAGAGSGEAKPGWGGVTVVRGDVVEYVRKLKAEGGRDIWLMGGGELARVLLRAGLVDVVEAAIMPAIVSKGVGMFGDGSAENETEGEEYWKLALENVEKKQTGIVMTRYRVVYDA